MSFSLIAAIGKNNELGKKGGLCFNIPGDLKFFKETTIGFPIFMGFNTWKSLPKKLPGREHFVLTSSPEDLPEDVHAVTDLEKFVKEFQDAEEKIFVIGGGSVYRQMLPFCKELFLTEVQAEDKEADTFFPEIKESEWEKKLIGKGEDNGIKYDHILYIRK